MLSEYAFWFLSFLAVFSAAYMILTKNPVYSVLSLILTFFSIAGHYFLLNAQFLAAVHIIVYAGAIMVLFLYVIMMLNMNQLDEEKKSIYVKGLSIVSACLLGFVLLAAIKRTDVVIAATQQSENAGLVENLGQVLYNDYLLPFEMASVLFLAAMVGAVYLSKKELA